jgi:DNA-binding MarR family transcriptional regulator
MATSRSAPAAERARSNSALRRAVRAVCAAVEASSRVTHEQSGLTNAQHTLLAELVARGPRSVNDLAARVLTGQSTVSVVASRLERAGRVERSRSESDRRKVMLRATRAGQRRITDAAASVADRDLDVAIAALRTEERRALHTGVSALLRELGRGDAHPG